MKNSMQTQEVPCWNYINGRCDRRNCKFAHPQGICFPPYTRQSPFAPGQPRPLPPSESRPKGKRDTSIPASEFNSQPTVYYKPIAWKTVACGHFMKTGACPMGERCQYVHDVALLRAEADDADENRGKLRHCWSFVQGQCLNKCCPYRHPRDIEPYKKHTPCLAWPTCPLGLHCDFKHPEPINDVQSIGSNPKISGNMASTTSHFFPGSLMLQSSSTVLPVAPTELNGTTYYPFSPPLSFLSPDNAQVVCDRNASYSSTMPMDNSTTLPPTIWGYLPYARSATRASVSAPVESNYGEGSKAWTGFGLQQAPMKNNQGSLPALSSSGSTNGNSKSFKSKDTSQPQKKFSHARRISVAIKKPSRTE